MLRRVTQPVVTASSLLATVFIGTACARMVTVGAVPPPRAGTNLLAGAEWEYSTDRGESWSKTPPLVRGGETAAIHLRTTFEVGDPSRYVVLELTHGLPGRTKMLFRLNGKLVPLPFKGMYYKTIPAIPASLLNSGINTLEGKLGFNNRPPRDQPGRQMPDVLLTLAPTLVALANSDLKITVGPVLGAMGKDFFTVTCRTNMPARVVAFRCDLSGQRGAFTGQTEAGLFHRLRLPRAGADARELHLLVADNGQSTATAMPPAPAYPKADRPFHFIAMGDSRTNPDDWAVVAAAALKTSPYLVVFPGDMVSRGRNRWEWDEQFFAPAEQLFQTVPFYAVIGNHEENAPIYPELFYTPSPDGRAKNWSQEINGVLFIGIDGQEDWSPGSENADWLEGILAGSRAKFIFLFSHYPAWSSANHGRLDEQTGRPTERPLREGQDTLVPLLVKYKATALICGHDHLYERSELPGGLTQIISGGAGAPRVAKTPQAAVQNPYSKVFAAELHYSLFQIQGENCTMKAVTPQGTVLDRRSWKARKVRQPAPPVGVGAGS